MIIQARVFISLLGWIIVLGSKTCFFDACFGRVRAGDDGKFTIIFLTVVKITSIGKLIHSLIRPPGFFTRLASNVCSNDFSSVSTSLCFSKRKIIGSINAVLYLDMSLDFAPVCFPTLYKFIAIF